MHRRLDPLREGPDVDPPTTRAAAHDRHMIDHHQHDLLGQIEHLPALTLSHALRAG